MLFCKIILSAFFIICGSFMCQWTWHEFNKLNDVKKSPSDSAHIWRGKLCKTNLSIIISKMRHKRWITLWSLCSLSFKPRIISSKIEISDVRNFPLLKICEVQVSFRPLVSTYLANIFFYIWLKVSEYHVSRLLSLRTIHEMSYLALS